jgi:hypothetical protein
MVTLRVQHPVPSFEGWKKAFDGDPADRKGSGVTHFRVQRPVDDANYVFIDLDFATKDEAQGLLEKMKVIWASGSVPVDGTPKFWIVETVESVELG